MLQNLIAVAFRNLIKRKVHSFITLTGLALGMAVAIMIFLYLEDEHSYDRFNSQHSQIYKVYLERIYPDHVTNYAIIPVSFAAVMESDIPGVKNSTRLFGNLNNTLTATYEKSASESRTIKDLKFMGADSTFFDLFSLPIVDGNGKLALSTAGGAILTRNTAIRLFGEEEALGKSIKTDGGTFTVMAVSENVPDQSHFDFDIMAGLLNNQGLIANENFVNFAVHTYLLLEPGTDPMAVEARFDDLVKKYAAPQIEKSMQLTFKDYTRAGNGYKYTLMNLLDIHLSDIKYQQEFKISNSKSEVLTYFTVGIMILLIAGINYTNLSVARSTERALEVGIRKALGSSKTELARQFVLESILMCLLALIVAIFIARTTMPWFNQLTDKQLALSFGSATLLWLVIFAVVIGILAGLYPALYISSVNTVSTLKGGTKSGKAGSFLRNTLVTFQFFISTCLLIATWIIAQQMNFIKNKDLGYDRNNLIVIERAFLLQQSQTSFLEELRKNGILATASSNIPANQYFGLSFHLQGESEPIIANGYFVDDEYIPTYGLELIAGRGFSRETNDSLSVVINEAMLKLLGLKDPIGQQLRLSGAVAQGQDPVFTISGVVADFNYMSVRDKISPFVLLNVENIPALNRASFYITAKGSNQITNTITTIENEWNRMLPDEEFQYAMLDDELGLLYSSDLKAGQKMGLFAGLAVIVSLIGLFGLSAYTIGLRTREIGIRKVLGSSATQVVILLTRDILIWVLIAFCLAVIPTWFLLREWLNGFAYRIDHTIIPYCLVLVFMLIVAILSVLGQAISASLRNPASTLKSE